MPFCRIYIFKKVLISDITKNKSLLKWKEKHLNRRMLQEPTVF